MAGVGPSFDLEPFDPLIYRQSSVKTITFCNLTLYFFYVHGKITSHHKLPQMSVGNLKRAKSSVLSFSRKIRTFIIHINMNQ